LTNYNEDELLKEVDEMNKNRLMEFLKFLLNEFEIVYQHKEQKVNLVKFIERINWVEHLELSQEEAE